MEFKHVVLIVTVCIGIGIGFIGLRRGAFERKVDYLGTIGILQTASHPALDAVRNGFIEKIEERVGDKIDFVIRNGQGSIANIHAIAQQFHAKNDIDGVFAIATPAAQAIVSVETKKPVCIAAVSVTPDLQQLFSQTNVFGASDMVNVHAQVDAIKALLPDVEKVGILYCTAEINSVAMADSMLKELEMRGYDSLLIGVTSEIDIEPALMSALRKVDIVFAPTDNMVANTISLIVDLTQKANKPLVVSDNMLVQYGALMARGIDYYESGRQAADLVLQIFVDGKKPDDLSIVSPDTKEIYVNKEVAERFNIIIPDSIVRDVVLV